MSEEKLKKEKTQLTLVIKDQDVNEIEFQVNDDVKLGKVLDNFAREIGKNSADLRLTYKGKIIGKNTTPFELGLIDREVLEVVASATGGFQ